MATKYYETPTQKCLPAHWFMGSGFKKHLSMLMILAITPAIAVNGKNGLRTMTSISKSVTRECCERWRKSFININAFVHCQFHWLNFGINERKSRTCCRILTMLITGKVRHRLRNKSWIQRKGLSAGEWKRSGCVKSQPTKVPRLSTSNLAAPRKPKTRTLYLIEKSAREK